MRKFVARFVVLMLALFASAPAWAQLDATDGTNVVSQVASALTTSGGLLKPIMIAVITICGCIGLYYRLVRKAKVGT